MTIIMLSCFRIGSLWTMVVHHDHDALMSSVHDGSDQVYLLLLYLHKANLSGKP
jgi:hypothetical protein